MDRLLSMAGLALRAGKVRFGVFMTEKALREGRAKAVVIASDLGKDNRKKILSAAGDRVPVAESLSRTEIGRALGKKEVPVFCICDENLAAAVINISKMAGKEASPDE